MQLACLSLAPLSNKLSCETGNFSHHGNRHSSQSALSLSFPFSQSCPHSPLSHRRFSSGCWLTVSLILWLSEFHAVWFFWHFWLFIDFRLVVTLFWLCKEAKGFYLHLQLGWNSPVTIFDLKSIFSVINIATLVLHWLLFVWDMFFHPSNVNVFVSLDTIWRKYYWNNQIKVLLKPSSDFFISITLLFSSKISFWFHVKNFMSLLIFPLCSYVVLLVSFISLSVDFFYHI